MPKQKHRYRPTALKIVEIAIQRTGSDDPHIVALEIFDVMAEQIQEKKLKVKKPSAVFTRIEEAGIYTVKDVSKVIEEVKKGGSNDETNGDT